LNNKNDLVTVNNMGRFSLFQKLVLLTAMLVFTGNASLAFDDDRVISDVHLFDETFLDINANAFRKSLDLVWYDTLSGWRMGGGSTSTDRLFLHTHLKVNHHLSEKFYLGFDLEQDDFYAKKPLQPFLLFADVYPFSSTDIGFSFLATTSVEKKESDLGLALTFGRRPTNYLRLSWLSTDHYFNEKNGTDGAYYAEPGDTLMLQSSYMLTDHWDLHLDWKRHTPHDYVFDDQISRFKNESYNYKTTIIYHFTQHRFAGIDLRAMNDTRSLLDATSDGAQDIDYQSLNVYWANGVEQDYELTIGLRYDDFKEIFRDRQNQANDYNFQLWTVQAYSALYHDFSTHQAWDLGLYVGWSERDKIYLASSLPDDINEGVEAKLRTSWEYHSADKVSRLLLSVSFNLDGLIDDPTDGAGINFQTRF
jgi:hypothetical protein